MGPTLPIFWKCGSHRVEVHPWVTQMVLALFGSYEQVICYIFLNRTSEIANKPQQCSVLSIQPLLLLHSWGCLGPLTDLTFEHLTMGLDHMCLIISIHVGHCLSNYILFVKYKMAQAHLDGSGPLGPNMMISNLVGFGQIIAQFLPSLIRL